MKRVIPTRDVCAYKDCEVTSRDPVNGHLFRFPSDDHRRLIWLTNCGNMTLEALAKGTVLHYGLCRKHFPAKAFTNTDQQKLNWNAVPFPYVSEQASRLEIAETNNGSSNDNESSQSLANGIEPAIQTSEDPVILPRSSQKSSESLPSNSSSQAELSNENDDLKREIERLRAANKRLRQENDTLFTKSEERALKIRRLQYHLNQIPKITAKAVAATTIDDVLRNHDPPLHPTAETMVRLQFHQANTPYDPDQQELLKQFHYHSASAYSRMRKAGLTLPGESTVRSWVGQYEITPGFCPIIFEKMKQKMATLSPSDRCCSLAWDEMSIKSYEEFSSKYDSIEGLVDLGPLGRKFERASYVFFFNLTSLNTVKKWRQPIAYFLSSKSGMAAEDIHSLLKECLERLEDSNVKVKLLVCDQGPQNQYLYDKLLQVNYEEATVFIGGNIYFIAFDFPHLIKRVVAALRKYGAIWQNGQIIVSWNDFTATYAFDKSLATSNLLGHISDIHLTPNSFQAMNVKRAFQIFGNRYAQAIKLWGNSLQNSSGSIVASNTWEKSATFAQKMNNIIDSCNSVGEYATNPNRRPLCSENPQVEEHIQDMIQWSRSWRIRNKSGFTVLPCFHGLQLTGNALLKVYHAMSQEYPTFKFATSRGNQDGTEHWFGLLRARNGNCQNPTARMVRLATRHVLSMGRVSIGDNGNVSCHDNDFLVAPKPSRLSSAFDNQESSSMNILSEIDFEEKSHETETSEGVNILQSFEQWENDDAASNPQEHTSLYEANAIAFFAGYVALKSIKKCQECKNDMCKSPMDALSVNELYIEFREFENVDFDAPTVTKLTRPTDQFAELVGLQLRAFDRVWKKHWASTSVLCNITADIKEALQLSAPDWLDQNHSCYNHRLAAMKFLVKSKQETSEGHSSVNGAHQFERQPTRLSMNLLLISNNLSSINTIRLSLYPSILSIKQLSSVIDSDLTFTPSGTAWFIVR